MDVSSQVACFSSKLTYVTASRQHRYGSCSTSGRDWSLAAASKVCAFPCLQSAVTRLAALPGGRLLASADEDGHLVATDVRTLGSSLTGEHAMQLQCRKRGRRGIIG